MRFSLLTAVSFLSTFGLASAQTVTFLDNTSSGTAPPYFLQEQTRVQL